PQPAQPSRQHIAGHYVNPHAARNHRIVARIAQQCELRFFLSPHDQGCRGKMLDLSPKGISFTSPATLQLNQIIKIQSPVLQATARVVHCKTKRARWDTEHTIGVSFISVEFTRPRGTFVSVAA
ncbi:MAG TPA: PilZ domain-containing protein, partial [Gammaproteobacteria bacterium]|nr:PilZ domain-containing protein [Gammaproteobacteria bacterium]